MVTTENETFTDWAQQAQACVDAWTPHTLNRLIQRDSTLQGTWHPFGFATFLVEQNAKAGKLAIHIWPKRRRGSIIGMPALHCHSFDMVSRVLAGTYIDRIYRQHTTELVSNKDGEPEKVEFAVGEDGVTFPHKVTGMAYSVVGYDAEAQFGATHQQMTLLGSRRPRVINKGESHRMPRGVYHVTNAPLQRLAVTLSVRRPCPGAQDVMVGRPNYKPENVTRREVTYSEFEIMCQQIADDLGQSAGRVPCLSL